MTWDDRDNRQESQDDPDDQADYAGQDEDELGDPSQAEDDLLDEGPSQEDLRELADAKYDLVECQQCGAAMHEESFRCSVCGHHDEDKVSNWPWILLGLTIATILLIWALAG